MPRGRRNSLLPILVLSWAVVACTESDDVFRDIGTTRVFPTDPDLRPQGLTEPESRIQAADWEILQADVDLDGIPLDLVFGEDCFYADSVRVFPTAAGKCGAGIVIEANDDPLPVRLSLTFTMEVKRAKPLILPDAGDFDGDGRLNPSDNCVLVVNPDQQDLDGDQIGDTCSLIDPFTGSVSLDSDVDGVADAIDNCVWVPNPLQEDSGSSVPDGIGDACVEQSAVVHAMGNPGNPVIQVDLGPIELVQPLQTPSYLTVDFSSTDALRCDWDAGVCELNTSQLTFCVQNDIVSASVGCF